MIAPNRHLKIGELLVARGVMTHEQVHRVIAEQARTARPFGDLAERLFGIDPRAVEHAWVDQYLSYDTMTDLNGESLDSTAITAVSRRQAWQFRILPLRHEHGHLLAATTRKHLRRAVNFAWSALHDPVCFLIADDRQLEDYLTRHYPWQVATSIPASR